MWLMKTLLTSRCVNQRGAGQIVNNRLDTNFEVATKQKMANILDRDRILGRLKKALYAK